MITCVYILTKNEAKNLERTLRAAKGSSLPIIVLDSGSTDDTVGIAKSAGAAVRRFGYVDHCAAYNEITGWHTGGEVLMILDADMQISQELVDEIDSLFRADPTLDTVRSPVRMFWAGGYLSHGSLCPPKEIAFRGGRSHFQPMGHGEQLTKGSVVATTAISLIHDDRRSYADELEKQWRYANATVDRARAGHRSWKDRIRLRTPLLAIAAPILILILRAGILAGQRGVLYATDRAIAELITYRASLARRITDGSTE